MVMLCNKGDAQESVLERMPCPLMAPDPQAVDPATPRWQYKPARGDSGGSALVDKARGRSGLGLPRGPGARG